MVRHTTGRAAYFAACILAVALIFSGIGVTHVYAQGASATILGTVTDMTGASVPDAAVQVRNVGTGISQSTVSNAQGRFVMPDLGIGDYEVQASKTGFSTLLKKGITLTVGSQTVVDFSLAVGQQASTVTVQAESSQVEVTNASLGTLIGGQQMSNLPINGRNFESLILLAPGVQTINTMAPNARQGRANVFSAAGARPEGFVLLMDDEAIDNFFRRGMGTITGSSLGMEAMAEFQTLTNTYGAQFGGNGAVMNAVSKSGTNQIHGSAYYFIRNSALDARGFFDNYVPPGATSASIPAFRRSQPGASIGGPVKKDKAFFFFNYEGIAQLQEQIRQAVVPDLTHRTPITVDPTTGNPTAAADPAVAKAIVDTLAIFPATGFFSPNAAAGTARVNVTGNNIAHENYILGRFDYTMNAKDSFFLRYFYDKQHVIDPYTGGNGSAAGGYLPYWPERDEGMNHFATVEWRRIVSPSLLNTVRVSFSRPNTGDYAVNSFPALQQVFPGAGRPDADVGISGLTTLGQSFFVPAVDIQNRFTEADDLVWTKGSHTLRIGAYVQRVASNVFYPFRSGSVWSFTGGLAQFRTGVAGANGVTGVPANQATCLSLIGVQCYNNRDYRETDITPYIQDDWKVNAKLTLNMGLRYEFATNPVEIHNAFYAVTNYATNTGLVNVPNANAENPNKNNWDPRFGFAYDMFANHKTALRGGFAITHSPVFVAQYNPMYTAVTPWPSFTQNSPVYPNINFSTVSNSVSPGWDYYINKAPYLIQYNLNIQRELMPGTILTVGYVGSHGVDMFTQQERNPPSFTIGPNGYNFRNAAGTALNPRLNPKFSTVVMATTGSTSRYNSLLASVNRRMSRNVQFQLAYTFSKCIDDGSSPLGSISGGNTSSNYMNPFDRSFDKGLCYFNAKSTLRLNSVVNLPFHGNVLVEGWQVSGIVTQNTGLPFSPYVGADTVGWAGSSNVRPNVIAGCNVQTETVGQWFNPACYTLPAPGALGNAARDSIIGPGLAQVDIALFKDTKVPRISESFRVQFRAEFFNLFNHAQFGLPGNSMFSAAPISTTTGQYTSSTPNASAGVISTLAGNTASRQIQFGLKFLF